jgi:3-methyl-2-oxobutanoate hydroxymethyltransferase
MLTAYDAPTAELLEREGVDIVLVGDSVGMVLLGYDSTMPVTMDEMIHHARAVRRGAKKSYVIGDLPLKGVEKGPAQVLASAKRFLREGGCQAVKLEWNEHCLESVRLLKKNRIPVMGHIGLTPQSAAKEGGYHVRGQEARKALELVKHAAALEKAGAFAVLLECVPSPVAQAVTERLGIPTFGIGAGPYCDGQVLVFHDVVGAFKKFRPRFVRKYADVHGVMKKAVRRFVDDVRRGKFPGKKESFGMTPEESVRFEEALR